jgi:hypothetical protein
VIHLTGEMTGIRENAVREMRDDPASDPGVLILGRGIKRRNALRLLRPTALN